MEIGIEEVLVKVNDTIDAASSQVRDFGFRFLNAEGETREILGRKYTRGSKQELIGRDVRGKDFYNLQANGVMLIQDITNSRTISIKPAMIYGFRDYDSTSWLNVFH